MREVIIIFFIVICVIMFTAGFFLYRYLSHRNKKIIENFLSGNNVEELGKFKCYVDKNFLSPSNQNYAFNSLRLFETESGFLICPTHNFSILLFKITLHLTPFFVGNKIGRYKNIDVNEIVEIRNMNNNTYIKLNAKYNTKIDLQIYGAEGIFDKVV